MGEIIGDFEVIRRGTKAVSSLVRCVHCGVEKTYTENTLKRGKMICGCQKYAHVCRNCGKAFKSSRKVDLYCSDRCHSEYYMKNPKSKRKAKDQGPYRSITVLTRKLICVYTAEGMTTEEISITLRRPGKVIKEILEECKKNGKYDFYIENSPILQDKRKRRCT